MALLDNTGLERLWAHIMSIIGGKVDSEDGKGLSTNDYTTEDKNTLDRLDGLVGDKPVDTRINEAMASISHPVTSVNSKTGAVTLTYSDVGADKSGAANTALTSAKAYTDEKIADIPHPVSSVNNKTGVVNLTASDVGADPAGTASELVAQFVGDKKVSESIAEAMATKADATHEHSAYVNQKAFSNVKVGSTTIAADSTTDTLTLVGNNVTLTPDATNDKVTVGLTKDNVVAALGYTPPETSSSYDAAGTSLGLVKSGGDVTIQNGLITVNDDSHNHTVANVDGLQTTLNNLSSLVGDKQVSVQINDALASYTGAVYTVTASSSDGSVYTATVPGITSLTSGAKIIIVPNMNSSTYIPTLNVNALGAQYIVRRSEGFDPPYVFNQNPYWFQAGVPMLLVYSGTYWIVESLPSVGSDQHLTLVVSETQPTNPITGTVWFQI